MKKLHSLHLFVALLCCELFLLSAQAADAKPPTKLTFQGFLTDSSGTALGAGSPVQKAVIFRIYAAETGGTLKWSEQQAVTVDKGHFSALLGEGSAVGAEPRNADLSTVFSGADASVRWMELSVDAAILTPRIQFVASPYAMLAKSATQLVGTDGSPAITPGSGTLTLAGTVSGNGSGLTSLNGANITAGTVGPTQLAPLLVDNSKVAAAAGIVDTKLATISTANKVADSALSANIPRLNAANAFLNNTTFKNNGTANPAQVSIGGNFDGPNNSNMYLTLGVDVYHILSSFGGVQSGDGVILAPFGKNIRIQPKGTVDGILLDTVGHVGIGVGNNTPIAALDVRGYVANSRPNANNYGFINVAGAVGNAANVPQNLSLFAEQVIWAGSFVIASSDERIKKVTGPSDSIQDLKTLLGLRVTDYTYRDVVSKGNTPQKKLIAQQVETIYPQAVSRNTGVVPDIYQKATQKDGWVQLATDLKKGERVRLIGEKIEGVHEVLEVADGKFRTDFVSDGAQIFVYGREVKDFRTLDYDAISMLNVSATQELARKVTAQEAELSELRSELARLRNDKKTLTQVMAELESRDARREARLLRLEQTAAGRNPNLQARNTGTAEEISGR